MTKVAEMIGDTYLPADVSREVALRIAGEMRQILNRDLDEADIALEVTLYESQIDRQNQYAAWGYLEASERSAWKNFLNLDEFLEKEKLRNERA